ncbi:hypothetical protein DSO57_1011399 [Entomophthora muscae]|uniref:Uncharacterized protein n=1 Tax=Entomophthora muscae TaxID=34485 RepID=A0ACC2UH27_9FUNG|nr:hypothetical protein DSO57_1011399 [Entomophthora muscae]
MRIKQARLLLVLVLLCALCMGNDVASELKTSIEHLKNGQLYSPQITLNPTARIAIGVGLIVVGAVFMFLGKFLLKVIFFFAGAGLMGGLTYMAADIIVKIPHDDPFPLKVLIPVVITAVIGGLIAIFFIKLGIVLLGGFLGASLAMLLIRTRVVQGKELSMGVAAGLVIVCCILAYVFSGLIIILATSFGGALMFIVGVDFFAQTGFADFVTKYEFINNLNPVDKWIWVMIGSVIFLTILSIFAQFKFSKKD